MRKPVSPVELSFQRKSILFIPLGVAVRLLGAVSCALRTIICRVAVSEPPRPSETLTVKVLIPTLLAPGVPINAPFEAIESHVGPLVLANASASEFGSPALLEILPEYDCP